MHHQARSRRRRRSVGFENGFIVTRFSLSLSLSLSGIIFLHWGELKARSHETNQRTWHDMTTLVGCSVIYVSIDAIGWRLSIGRWVERWTGRSVDAVWTHLNSRRNPLWSNRFETQIIYPADNISQFYVQKNVNVFFVFRDQMPSINVKYRSNVTSSFSMDLRLGNFALFPYVPSRAQGQGRQWSVTTLWRLNRRIIIGRLGSHAHARTRTHTHTLKDFFLILVSRMAKQNGQGSLIQKERTNEKLACPRYQKIKTIKVYY